MTDRYPASWTDGQRARGHSVTESFQKLDSPGHHLGRYDYELNATIVPETESRSDFGLDARTGRQAIGAPESVRRVLDEPGTTLVVIEASKIGRASGVTTEALDVIGSRCGELSLPEGTGVRAWWCGMD